MNARTETREYKRGYVASRRLTRERPSEWTRGGYDRPDAFDRGWRDGHQAELARRSEREDRLCANAYCAGLTYGWNCAMTNDQPAYAAAMRARGK